LPVKCFAHATLLCANYAGVKYPKLLGGRSSLYSFRHAAIFLRASNKFSNQTELDGMFARIAKQFRVHPSFVYRVAYGQRNSEKIMRTLEAEMERLEKLNPR
jgi:hypothetical protein